MSGVLDGRMALVTGGSRGIGRAVVERLARDGATCRRSRYPAAQRSSYPPPGPWDSCLLDPTSFRPAERADEVGDLIGKVVGRRPAQL